MDHNLIVGVGDRLGVGKWRGRETRPCQFTIQGLYCGRGMPMYFIMHTDANS